MLFPQDQPGLLVEDEFYRERSESKQSIQEATTVVQARGQVDVVWKTVITMESEQETGEAETCCRSSVYSSQDIVDMEYEAKESSQGETKALGLE